MALEVIIAPTARRDLEDIFEFIAVDDAGAAARVLKRVETTVARLAEFPFMGRAFMMSRC